jgi:hypothetical protein
MQDNPLQNKSAHNSYGRESTDDICIARYFTDENLKQDSLLVEYNMAKHLNYNQDENEKNNLLATLMVLSHNVILVVSDKNYLQNQSQ